MSYAGWCMDKISEPDITIRNLYPHFNEEQLKEAEESIELYIELVLRIYDRIRSDPPNYADFRALTEAKESPIMDPQGQTHPKH